MSTLGACMHRPFANCKDGAIAALYQQVVICEHTPAAMTQQQQLLYSGRVLQQNVCPALGV
jgi:hypothetical protein